MPSLALTTALALFAAQGISAQDVVAQVWAYSTNQCAGDAFGSSTDLEVYTTNTVLAGEDWSCMYSETSLPGFEKDDAGDYDIYIAENTIPDDCSLVLYQPPPEDDGASSGPCTTFYAIISGTDGACFHTNISPNFGYAMCCGDNCQAVAKKRSVPTASKRDVVAHKRSAPLNNLKPRTDCSFDQTGDSIITYGAQEKVIDGINCPAGTETCSESYTFTYTSSTTTTFGVSSEVGASAFEIFSASITFSTEVSHEESQGYSMEHTVTTSGGQGGYVTFTPKYECTPDGTLSGSDCDGLPTGQVGKACYPVFLEEKPDGFYTFVQTTG